MPNQSSIAPDPSNIPFYDPQASVPLLVQACSRLSAGLATSLPGLLAESPDPDSAILLIDRLLASSPKELLTLLERHPTLVHYAIAVFGHSRFLGETLLQNTDLLPLLLKERTLDRTLSVEDFREALARYRARCFEKDFSVLLAKFKRREYVRIMLRDVLDIAPLAETTAELSSLADALIQEAVQEAAQSVQRRHGSPQYVNVAGRAAETPFAAFSLGKLGGSELNYCSDVDLLYVFGDGDAPAQSAISNHEYFVRLAQSVTELLSRPTSEGAVFRIDLRLRPQGNEGEVAVNLSRAVRYYSEIADDWERQALIKVRLSAGDAALARAFIREVQPGIYAGEPNFEAIETALEARRRMHLHRSRPAPLKSPESLDVKVDRGGIRDIEFLVQCLQRVYGGSEPWLRSGGTIFALQKLYDKRHISGKDFHELTSAYEFLRHLEHRLQLRLGQQTHRLPTDRRELRAIDRALKNWAAGRFCWADLPGFVQQMMEGVAQIQERIIHQQQAGGSQAAGSSFELRAEVEPSQDLSSRQILERLADDSPPLYEVACRQLPPRTRANLFRLFSSCLTSSSRYALLLRHPDAVVRALALFESSDYLSDILVHHPEELSGLSEAVDGGGEHGSLFEHARFGTTAIGDPVFGYLARASSPLSERRALLRQHYRHKAFSAGAHDITSERAVYESFADNTAAAEDAIRAAFGMAGEPSGLAVMALGRLGSGEFDMLSDADLFFVCAPESDRQVVTNAAEDIIHSLSAYTSEGMVFPLDVRLRPHGREGELVLSTLQMADYCEREAQAWEALTYTKLRYVAGSRDVSTKAMAAASRLFGRFAEHPNFTEQVRHMRNKLSSGQDLKLKTSPGAMYDIDFVAGSLLVMNRIANMRGTVRDRLWRCVEVGVLAKTDAAILDHAAELFRTVEHVVRLVTGKGNKWLPASEHGQRVTEKLVSGILRREFRDGLEQELLATFEQVHGIYNRILASAGSPAAVRGGQI